MLITATLCKFLCFLLSIGVIVLGLLLPKYVSGIHYYDVYWTHIIAMCLGLLCLAVIWLNRKKYHTAHAPSALPVEGQRDKVVYVDHVAYFLEKHAHTLGIYIFGAGSIYLRVFWLVSTLQCLRFYNGDGALSWKQYDLIGLIRELTSIMFLLVQLPMLHKMSHFRHLKRKFHLHNAAILGLILVNIGYCVNQLFEEAGLVHLHIHNQENRTTPIYDSLEMACYNHSTVMDIYFSGSLMHTFFPISTEFTLAALEVLIHVWLFTFPPTVSTSITGGQSHDTNDGLVPEKTPRPLCLLQGIGFQLRRRHRRQRAQPPHEADPQDDAEFEVIDNSDEHDSLDELRRLLDTSSDSVEIDHVHNRWYHRMWLFVMRCLNLYTAMFCGLTHIMLLSYYLIHCDLPNTHPRYMNVTQFDAQVKLPVLIGRCLVLNLPGMLASLHAVAIMSTFKMKRPGVQYIQGSDVLLVMGTLGMLVLNIYYTVTDLSKFSSKETTLEIIIMAVGCVESLTIIPQFIVLYIIIYYGERYLVNVYHRFYRTLQSTISFLVLFNFAQWVGDSFFETQYYMCKTEFGVSKAGTYFVHFVYPLLIYFRYLSTILLLKLKNLLTESEIKHLVNRGREMDSYDAAADNNNGFHAN